MRRKIAFPIFLVFLIFFTIGQLTPSFAGAINNTENFVDANSSNIDNHANHGTFSNFTAEQYADLINDTLTEENTSNSTGVLGSSTASTTGSTTLENQVVGSLYTLSVNGWTSQIMAYIGVTTAAKLGKAAIYRHNDLALMGQTGEISLTVGTSWRTFTFSTHVYLPYDSYILVAWCASGSGNGLLYYGSGSANQGHIDPNTYEANFANPMVVNSHNAFNYDINCSMIYPLYEFDAEFSWTTADYAQSQEYLCIRTDTYSGSVAENVKVDVWNGAGWTNIAASLTASSWNNISISTYLTSATIYFRFLGQFDSSDTIQNTWKIECSLIHTWSTDYPLDLSTTATMSLSTLVQVSYHINLVESTSVGITLDVINASAKTESVDLGLTAQVRLDTFVKVDYHITTNETTTTSLTLDGKTQETIPTNVTGTITLTTTIQVTQGIPSNLTGTITLTTSVQVSHGILDNLTGTVTFTTLVEVRCNVELEETTSLLLNLAGLSEMEVPPNATGLVSLNVLVETSYHVELSEAGPSINLDVDLNLDLAGEYEAPSNMTGSIAFSAVVQVGYHVTTAEVQTLTLSQSKTANYTKPLSLMPYFTLSVSISGNFSSPTSSGSNGTGSTGPQASGNVFDVRIVRLAYVYRFEQTLTRSVSVTVNFTNVGTTSGDAVWDWWVDGTSQDKLVSRTETGFVGAGQSNLFICTFDLEQGDYVFNAEVKSIAGNVLSSRAMASLAFSVGYIYTDFMKDNFVLILIVCFAVIICILSYRRRKQKHSRNSRRKRKSHRR